MYISGYFEKEQTLKGRFLSPSLIRTYEYILLKPGPLVISLYYIKIMYHDRYGWGVLCCQMIRSRETIIIYLESVFRQNIKEMIRDMNKLV